MPLRRLITPDFTLSSIALLRRHFFAAIIFATIFIIRARHFATPPLSMFTHCAMSFIFQSRRHYAIITPLPRRLAARHCASCFDFRLSRHYSRHEPLFTPRASLPDITQKRCHQRQPPNADGGRCLRRHAAISPPPVVAACRQRR
jgi:hypothetical protein